jgi:acetylornithine deacetylase/succinyl-diaminopimelate desuccinylase-like protein
MSASISDAGWLGPEGIQTFIYGPGKLADAHAVDEKISITATIGFYKSNFLFYS